MIFGGDENAIFVITFSIYLGLVQIDVQEWLSVTDIVVCREKSGRSAVAVDDVGMR